MEKTLVLLAAGLGSRYGSFKQIDGVGPNGELLMQYAVFDAMRAGFTRIVFIIKPDMLLTAWCGFAGCEAPRHLICREQLFGRDAAGELAPLETL